MDLLGESCPQNPILFFEVIDILGQFGLGGRGDQGQQRVVNPVHRGMFAISNLESGYTFTEHRFVRVRAVKHGHQIIGPDGAGSREKTALKISGRFEPWDVGGGKSPH